MKGVFISLITGIFVFFILIFIQEYDTFIMPLIKDTNKYNFNADADGAIKSLEEFNTLLRDAYLKLDAKLIEKLPAQESVIEQFVVDIKDYKKNNLSFVSVSFKYSVKDKFFFDKDLFRLTVNERWEYRLKGRKSPEMDNLMVDYTLKNIAGRWIITDMKISGIYEEQNL